MDIIDANIITDADTSVSYFAAGTYLRIFKAAGKA